MEIWVDAPMGVVAVWDHWAGKLVLVRQRSCCNVSVYVNCTCSGFEYQVEGGDSEAGTTMVSGRDAEAVMTLELQESYYEILHLVAEGANEDL